MLTLYRARIVCLGKEAFASQKKKRHVKNLKRALLADFFK